ncbi:MAG: hypothetical protein ACLR4Z_08015 [Butyricicoccaceae bacterium]
MKDKRLLAAALLAPADRSAGCSQRLRSGAASAGAADAQPRVQDIAFETCVVRVDRSRAVCTGRRRGCGAVSAD